MGVDIKEDFLQKEEWINNIKFISPRPRYNHIELQGEIYMQLKQYFKKRCNVSIEAALFFKRVTSSLSRTPGGFKNFQWQAYVKA